MIFEATPNSLNPLPRTRSERTSPSRKEGSRCQCEMAAAAAKSHVAMASVWGLSSSFKPAVALFLAVVLVLGFFANTRHGDQEAALTRVASNGSTGTCDLFSGRWVYDNTSYPLYSESGCKFLSDQSACEKFGRKDLKYRNWRWQPHDCHLPRFDATKLLERLRNKRMVFVGDSLNRNQWNSMVCLLGASVPDSDKIIAGNGSLVSFRVKKYNASIDYYWEPLLVESNSDDPVHHKLPDRIVRVQAIEKHARHWTNSDILVFNTFLWWRSRARMEVLWGSFGDQDGIYKKIKTLRAYELTLQTWSDWLELHVDHARTQLFFVSMASTHLWAEEWGKSEGQNCYGETEPVAGREGYWGRQSDPTIMRAVEAAIEGLSKRGVRVQMLNITQLSEYRKDGHPSIYKKQWDPLTKEQEEDPVSYADCIHWCLPGVPDVWNELLYAYIFAN